MVIQLQTSFMPKKPPVTAPTAPRAGRRMFNVLALVSISVFSVAAVLSVLVFLYQAHLVRVISDMDTELIKARKSFEPEFIEEASRLNTRIEAARELINNHRALSPLFGVLEKKTLESVRFRDFSFDSSSGREATLVMTGQAKSFNAVALQSDVFGSERAFKDPVFSNFALNEQGDIVFNFKTSLDPALLRYSETVLGNAAGGGNAGKSGEDAAVADFEEEAME
jgi:hypothetical protein